MAACEAVLDIVTEPDFLANVTAMGARLKSSLQQMIGNHDDLFEGVKGVGLMLGLKVRAPYESRAFVNHARAHGVLTVAAGDNVVRVLPPLTIGEEHIAEFIELLSAASHAYRPAQAA